MSGDRLALALAELAGAIREEVAAASGPPAPDRLYSIPEAAAQMGIGRTLLYQMIGRGELRIIRAGRRVMVSSSAVSGWIAQASR
jgi:excisionase family DNA binding protein